MSRRDGQRLGFDPVILRTLLDAYGRMLRELNVMRHETDSVAELLAIAAATDEVQSKHASCQRRLDRVECQRHTEARREARYQASVAGQAVAS